MQQNIHGAVGIHVPSSDYDVIVDNCDARHHVNRWPIICPCGTRAGLGFEPEWTHVILGHFRGPCAQMDVPEGTTAGWVSDSTDGLYGRLFRPAHGDTWQVK